MQRHVTSVFSDYESMENNSVNSKQLEYWLKQISSPRPSPNLGFQWTFMSNHSSQIDKNSNHPPNNTSDQPHDNISFGKSPFSSIDRDKQNNSLLHNVNHRNSSETKSKSYVNAMIALQKKVKTLEDQNNFMRKNITKINQERVQSMTESSITEEQLKTRLKVIEPKVAKIDELIQTNKILRETKEEKTRKIKALEKSNSDLKAQNEELLKMLEEIRKQSNGHKLEAENGRRKISELEAELKKLLERNKMLEDMKEKSTITLLEKYNKSIEQMESFEKENLKLKNQMNYLKARHLDEIKNIQQTQTDQIKKYLFEFEKLKESINLKNSVIQEKKKEAEYFRDAYQKKGEQFQELLRSHHKIIENERTQAKQLEFEKSKIQKPEIKAKQKLDEKEIKQKSTLRLPAAENVHPVSQESSVIRMPQTHLPSQSPPVKRSFEGFDSEEQDQFEESAIPISVQTKSVGKPIKRRKVDRKGVLSSSSRKEDSKKKIDQNSLCHNKNIASPREHKKIMKRKRNNEKEDGSFTMKSYEPPKTQPMHRITFEPELHSNECEDRERIANSYYYTSQYPPLPHLSNRNQLNDIQDFHKNNTSSQSIDRAMMVELSKEILQLCDEHENLILASNDWASQADRSQFVGRQKLLNEQLRIKNQKLCELKSKL